MSIVLFAFGTIFKRLSFLVLLVDSTPKTLERDLFLDCPGNFLLVVSAVEMLLILLNGEIILRFFTLISDLVFLRSVFGRPSSSILKSDVVWSLLALKWPRNDY